MVKTIAEVFLIVFGVGTAALAQAQQPTSSPAPEQLQEGSSGTQQRLRLHPMSHRPPLTNWSARSGNTKRSNSGSQYQIPRDREPIVTRANLSAGFSEAWPNKPILITSNLKYRKRR